MYYSHSSPLQEISPTSRCFGNLNLNISDINNYLSFQTEETDQEIDRNAINTRGAKLQQTSRHSNLKSNINPHTNFTRGRRQDCFEINRQQMRTKISKDKEDSGSLFREFSLYNDFSASVREMLRELGLKPPVSDPLENVERNLSIECIPKPSSLLENTVLMSKLEKIDCIVPPLNCSNLSSRNRSTNQILDLEKEIFRRKHCEHLIQDLQQKLLSNEQELALVSAVNEKKSLVIKELRQVMENLAISWKKLEDSQIKTIKDLQNECDNLKESLKQKNKELENSENALSSMKENLSELNCKLSEKEEKLNSEILYNEGTQKTLDQLREKLQKESTFVEELKIEIVNLQKCLEKEQHISLQKMSEFDQSKQKLQQQLSEEIEKKNELQTKLDEVAFSLEMMSADNFALKEQLELIMKEKNFAEEELRRRESEYIGQEIEWKSKMDKKINELETKYEEKEKHLKEQLEAKYEAEISARTSEYENWKEEELSKYEIKFQELKDNASIQNEQIQQQ
ncbi:centrobin-like [Centruroides sculpturatus]|uniref:centrobin-like n=1 Tax=Centruroides sculpturatus TaxID=218467 RepID=UPI000C6DC0F9|nr:centrobin-like [Centruroides sculpturatus]